MVGPSTNARDTVEIYEKLRGAFIDEARTLARFNHPNFVKVLRYVEENNSAYIIMEFVPGLNLRSWLRQYGQMNEAQLRPIILAVAEGLKLLHSHGVLHRDIKPENIILRNDHIPVLIDFGAARKAIGRNGRSVTAMWTPGYAPIEQISESGELGPYSDIYALGATAYMALVGHPPGDCVSRYQHDDVVPIQEAAKGQACAQFLQAMDWAIKPDRRDRPQTLDEWLATFAGSAASLEKIPPQLSPAKLSTVTTPIARVLTEEITKAPVGGAVQSRRNLVFIGAAAAMFIAAALYFGGYKSDALIPSLSTIAASGEQPAQTEASDADDFARAQVIDVPEAYQLYLRLHPNGKFSAQATTLARQ